MIEFTVPGDPVAWQRVAGGRGGKAYVPTKTRDAENRIAWAFRAAARGWRLDRESEFCVHLEFYRANLRHKDIDNMVKLVLDGLNGVAYGDDRQVSDLHVKRRYGDPNPRTVVRIDRRL